MMKAGISTHIFKDERGLASFIVTFVLMLIISLVTLSFAQIIRREQQQALDRHLSSRAFYVAESGINLAINALNNGYPGSKTDCAPDGSGQLDTTAYVLDGPSGTELNCLTIDDSPTSLEYSSVLRGQSLVIPINAQSNMNRLDFSWQSTTATTTTSYAGCNPGNGFTPQASWGCAGPLFRIDMVDTNGALNRGSLTNGVFTVFLYPTPGGGAGFTTFNAGNRGAIVNARCAAASTPKHCNVTMNMPGGSRQYYARVLAYYSDATLTITPHNGASPVELAGAQAIIDSTGKAQDVTRRLQVRKSLANSEAVPEFGVDAAAGLCKRYLVMAGNGTPGSAVLNLSPIGGGTLHDGGPCALD
jgi:Tfp pilus assembly protein PilX